MIHDKDHLMRIVKQFSEFIASRLLGKNEGPGAEEQAVFETQMKDVFKMNFGELESFSSEEIRNLVESKDPSHHTAYYELLGHLFFYKFQESPGRDYA